MQTNHFINSIVPYPYLRLKRWFHLDLMYFIYRGDNRYIYGPSLSWFSSSFSNSNPSLFSFQFWNLKRELYVLVTWWWVSNLIRYVRPANYGETDTTIIFIISSSTSNSSWVIISDYYSDLVNHEEQHHPRHRQTDLAPLQPCWYVPS